MSPFEILVLLVLAGCFTALAKRTPPPPPLDLAPLARALSEGQQKRDQDFLLHARLLTEKIIDSNRNAMDKNAVLLQAMLSEAQKATMIGGTPLALEEAKVALEQARIEHARRTREEDLEAFRIAARSGVQQPPAPAPINHAPKNPLA